MDTSKQPISPLRQRMIEDMRMRKFGEKHQQSKRLIRKHSDALRTEGSLCKRNMPERGINYQPKEMDRLAKG